MPVPGMQRLLDRGRDALRVFAESQTVPESIHRNLLVGTGRGLHVVMRADFVAYADLCLAFVEENAEGKPCHVLCPDGNICTLVSKHPGAVRP